MKCDAGIDSDFCESGVKYRTFKDQATIGE